MEADSAVKKYRVPEEVYHKFMLSHQVEKPEYEFLAEK